MYSIYQLQKKLRIFNIFNFLCSVYVAPSYFCHVLGLQPYYLPVKAEVPLIIYYDYYDLFNLSFLYWALALWKPLPSHLRNTPSVKETTQENNVYIDVFVFCAPLYIFTLLTVTG